MKCISQRPRLGGAQAAAPQALPLPAQQAVDGGGRHLQHQCLGVGIELQLTAALQHGDQFRQEGD